MCGGGTAGHVFPALAVAAELQTVEPGIDVHFVGSVGGLEESIVPDNGYTISTLPIKGMPRKHPLALIAFAWNLLKSLIRGFALLRRERPDLVMGFGGYASAPMVLLAPWMGIPTILHEQNSVPGVVTRWAARRASVVAVTYSQTKRYLPKAAKVVHTGNPVRPSVMRPLGTDKARRHLALRPDSFTVLVFGGSRGARRINSAVIEAWPELYARGIQLLFVTGEAEYQDVSDQIGDIRPNMYPFYKDIQDLYSAADMIVCRAGATSIAEITALGKPALLVPYPFATDDHQKSNARSLQEVGAAAVIPDPEMNGETLVSAIIEMAENPLLVDRMARASLDYGMPDSGIRLAELVVVTARSA